MQGIMYFIINKNTYLNFGTNNLKTQKMKNIILILVIAFWSLKSNAQIEKLSGPRFGVTFLSAGSGC